MKNELSSTSLLPPSVQALLPQDCVYVKPAADWWRETALKSPLQVSRRMTRQHASTFYFASHVLPAHKRQAAYAVYAFCRYVDDVIDENPEETPEERVLLSELDRILDGSSSLPFAPALRAAAEAFGISRQLFADLIHGCCMDHRTPDIQTFEDLAVYCYYVASVVGLMMSRIFGLSDPGGVPRAVELGIAMQLTNILRDVREDYERGRIYLPADDMQRFGISPGQLRARLLNRRWVDFMRFQVIRAERFYTAAEPGIALLDRDGSQLATRLMADLYKRILGVIEARNYDVFRGRAYVPLSRKLVYATSLWLAGCRTSSGQPAR